MVDTVLIVLFPFIVISNFISKKEIFAQKQGETIPTVYIQLVQAQKTRHIE